MWKEAAGDTIQIRVTPKAASNHIRAEEQADGMIVLRVYVTAVPEDGKANKAVIALLAKELSLPKSALSIGRGSTGRNKIIHIQR